MILGSPLKIQHFILGYVFIWALAYTKLNQSILFFALSDWLLKLGIALHLVFTSRDFSVLAYFPEKKELFSAGYPPVWYILKQLFTSVSVKSGRYLPPPRSIIVN